MLRGRGHNPSTKRLGRVALRGCTLRCRRTQHHVTPPHQAIETEMRRHRIRSSCEPQETPSHRVPTCALQATRGVQGSVLPQFLTIPEAHRPYGPPCAVYTQDAAGGLPQTLKQACSQKISGSAMCVQRFDDSLSSAIHITYRISLRSSSLQ